MLSKLRHLTYKLLRRSEQYTQTDMVYLAKGGFWLSIGQVIYSVSAFFLAIAFANLLPKETYGVYHYILSLLSIIAVFALSGINTAVVQSVARGYEGLFWKIFKTKMLWSLLSALSSLILAGYYYLNNNFILAISFIIIAIGLPLIKTSTLYIALLNGRKDFKMLTIYNSWIKILSVLTMIGVLFFTDNIFLILAAYFIPQTILQFFFTLIYIKKHPLNKNKDTGTVAYGINLSAMELLKTVASQVDKILIFHYLGAVQLAIYGFATAPVSQIKSVVMNLKSLALPKLSEVSEKEIKLHFMSKLRRLEIVVALIIIVYVLLAPYLYQIAFPQYMESIRYSQAYALILLFLPRTFLSTVLIAKRKQKELYAIRIISPIFRIIILFIGLKFFGLWGLILAVIVSEAFLFIIYKIFFEQAFKKVRV